MESWNSEPYDDNLFWRKVSSSRWERGIDDAEQYYSSLARLYQSTGRVYYALTAHVSVLSEVPGDFTIDEWQDRLDTALRRAWLYLRVMHPTITTWVEWREERNMFVKVYEKPTGKTYLQALDAWFNQTFQVVLDCPSGAAFADSDPPSPSIPTLYMVTPKEGDYEMNPDMVRRDLVLRLPHDVIDGIGTFQLLNILLNLVEEALNNPDRSFPDMCDEWARLNPPLKLALGLPFRASNATNELNRKIADANASLGRNANMLVLPYISGKLAPGRTQRLEINLSHSRTQQILSACKELGVTVTHAYHAAAILSLAELQGRSSSGHVARYVGSGYINLRERCLMPCNTSSCAVSVYHASSPNLLAVDVAIPPALQDQLRADSAKSWSSDEYRHVLEQVRNYYVALRTDYNLLELCPLAWRRETPSGPWHGERSRSSTLPAAAPLPNQNPSFFLSSMGNLDDQIKHNYGHLEAHNVWVVGDELDTGLGLFLTTFRGKLSLNATFNESWHDSPGVKAFLNQCHDIVLASGTINDNKSVNCASCFHMRSRMDA